MWGYAPSLQPELYRQHIPCGGHERLCPDGCRGTDPRVQTVLCRSKKEVSADSHGHDEKTGGPACFSADPFADAHELRHDLCGNVPPASAPQETSERAYPTGAEEHAGGTA